MTDTAIASAVYIVAGAASKEPHHNDALNRLEQLAQITVVNRTTTSAPAAPAQGAAYIVASGATGVWSAQADKVAAYYSGWLFLNAREGWRAYDQGADQTLLFDGSVWDLEPLGRSMLMFQNGNAPKVAGATRYIGLGREDANEAVAGLYRAAFGGVLKNLRARLFNGPGAGESVTFTVRKNASDTALAVVVASTATSGADTANSVAVAAGDSISVKQVTTASAATNIHTALTMELKAG